MTSPLEQCRDALRDVALDLAVAQQAELASSYGALLPRKHAAAARDREAIESALAAADAALAAQPEPVAWAQLGMRNGHTYVRMNYEGHLYPPPADVQRNLNLTPLYAAPVAQPLTIPKERLALNVQHKDCHKAANAFWQYWSENGETHKRGYYESTWGAINRALRTVGVVEHDYPAAPKEPA